MVKMQWKWKVAVMSHATGVVIPACAWRLCGDSWWPVFLLDIALI